ncbi:MAG: guanosine monophosphate reductase, partial [Bdellovibrionales bacterium]|nr:guanosine monophosphate reductase [Bdellovibrionales bacterium]
VGVKTEGMRRADLLAEQGVDILTVDIAHGDSVMMLSTLDYIKQKYPQIDVIAGNVATADGVLRMLEHGADAIKVGIGPGSMCTTRIITGHGVPQLTAVALAVSKAKEYGIPVIADGGIRNSGDIVKALTVGASTVMLGSMVAGTTETPGEVKGGRKSYRGMASKEAQVSWRGELPTGMAAEGVATTIPCKGSVIYLVNELMGGIRSGMTYLGVDHIEGMAHQGLFMEVSSAGMVESKPHGL